MTRVLAVVALVGCACGQSVSNGAAPTCPACPRCPEVPTVDLALCPVERPAERPVAEPEGSALLRGGSGFWCTAFLDGELAGDGACFRYREPCENRRRRYHKRYKMDECRPAERASCVKVTNYIHLGLFYRCFPPAQCERIRAELIARNPDFGFTECRESD